MLVISLAELLQHMAGTESSVVDRQSKGHSSGFGAAARHWRRRNRGWLNRLLVRIFGTPEVRRQPLAADTRRILVVRLNKRLGNILFLTPMLQSLAATLPAARIDVLIRSRAQKPLLKTLPGVDRVLVQEPRFLDTLRTLREVRRQRYDLAGVARCLATRLAQDAGSMGSMSCNQP